MMHKKNNQKNMLFDLGLVGLLTACICFLYLPWKWTSFLLIPLYLFAWKERKALKIDRFILNSFGVLVVYLLFFSIFTQSHSHSFKGMYDCLRGLLLFPVGIVFAQRITGKWSWFIVNCVALIFVLLNFLFPQIQGFYSIFTNPNNAAVLLVILICFLIPPTTIWIEKYYYFASAIGLALASYQLYLTNGRGAWLGVSIGLISVFMFRAPFAKRFKVILIFCIISTLSVLLIKFNRKGFRHDVREDLWSGLLNDTVENNFYFGSGLNTVKDQIDHLGLLTRTAHNIELEIFVSSGILGLFIVIVLGIYLVRSFTEYSYRNSSIFFVGFLGLISFLIMGQFDLKFASFRFIGTISLFLGFIYSQKIPKIIKARD